MERRRLPSLFDAIIVVCEGASENAYLQELNRFFREHRIPLTFAPRVVGNGAFKAVAGYFRNIRRFMRDEEILIWVDLDIYTHSEANNYLNKPASIPDFLFSEMNFEDFLLLHMDRNQVLHWQSVAEKYDHFRHPMPAAVYMPIYKTAAFKYYRKGRMPFKINAKTLGQLFMNLHDKKIRFRNGFGLFIENRLREMGWLVDEEEKTPPATDGQAEKNASETVPTGVS